MTSFLSTVTDRLPSMETVSSYIPSNEDVTAGFGKVQDSASKAWKNTSETFSDGLERAKNSYEKLDPKTRKYLESSAIAAAVVSASALAYVNRENISNGASALVDSSREGYKAISDNVAPLRRTEEVEARTPEEVNVRDEAFDLHTSRRKFCRLGEAEVRLTGRIKRAAKRGDVQAQLKLKANRTLIRHKMKTLKKTINRMGFSAGPIDPEVYRNMDGATHQDLFRGGWLT